MRPPGAARSRALSIVIIVACLGLGTIIAINRKPMWPYFVAVFYGIALINIAGELLLPKLEARRTRRRAQGPQPAPDDSTQRD